MFQIRGIDNLGTLLRTTATAGQAFRGKGLVASLALALLVTVGAATSVGAERPTGIDGVSVACRGIYDRVHRLLDEYKAVATANPGDPRLDTILAQLRDAGSDWIRIGCRDAFGSVVTRVESPFAVDPGQGIVADPINDVVADPGQDTTPDPVEVITADPGQGIVADPGQDVVADPGQDTPAPAEDAEVIPVGDEAGGVVLDDDELVEVGDLTDEQP